MPTQDVEVRERGGVTGKGESYICCNVHEPILTGLELLIDNEACKMQTGVKGLSPEE